MFVTADNILLTYSISEPCYPSLPSSSYSYRALQKVATQSNPYYNSRSTATAATTTAVKSTATIAAAIATAIATATSSSLSSASKRLRSNSKYYCQDCQKVVSLNQLSPTDWTQFSEDKKTSWACRSLATNHSFKRERIIVAHSFQTIINLITH